MNSDQRDMVAGLIGFIIGAAVVALLWLGITEEVEKSKVKAGYLTLHNKTYQVTLYDTLDVPKRERNE